MPFTPALAALVALSTIAAAPISLHFEGNEGTLEPFLAILPLAALVAGVGIFAALRVRAIGLSVLNALTFCAALIFWIGLLTFEGG